MHLLLYQFDVYKKQSNRPALQEKKPILYHSIRVIADDSKSPRCALLAFYLQCDTTYLFSIQTVLILTCIAGQKPVG